MILPGVGHFGQMMHAMDQLALREPHYRTHQIGRAVPGHLYRACNACLKGAKKRRAAEGLAFSRASSSAFIGDARIPHMGWNSLDRVKPVTASQGLGPERLHLLRP